MPARGFKPIYYLFGMGAIVTYGWYKLFYGIRERKYVGPILFPDPAGLGTLTNPSSWDLTQYKEYCS